MAGGDLLYIGAFIILPTAVLVSCIWALLLLRNGRLLPPRPVARYEMAGEDVLADDEREDEPNPVEETGEHVVIAPAQPIAPPVPVAPTTAMSTGATVAPAAPVISEPPPAERTQEMAAVPVEEPAGVQRSSAEAVGAEPAEIAEMTESEEAPAAAKATPDAGPNVEPAPDLLLVPLDEPLVVQPDANGVMANGTNAAAAAVEADAANQTTPATPSRRAPRRVGLPRQTNDGPPRSRPRTGQRRAARRSESEG
ncbi:MAG TPA: hypothetical protein VFV93_09700 [Thermomicrobiales bacterium]|nr:hypothetical protein [Thermomicrobiales bacterium]